MNFSDTIQLELNNIKDEFENCYGGIHDKAMTVADIIDFLKSEDEYVMNEDSYEWISFFEKRGIESDMMGSVVYTQCYETPYITVVDELPNDESSLLDLENGIVIEYIFVKGDEVVIGVKK
jgi:hypothetical protein